MSIKLNGINCFYGAHQALFDITLNCPEGETLVLLGPSGAGKSSLLRVLNLLEMPRSGTLAIAGNHFDFAKTPSDKAIRELRQNVGMVFQQYNLWPHLTVLQNLIEAPCRVLGLSKDQAIARADLFVSIGTSGAVYPAAGFVRTARYHGAATLELNLDPSEGSIFFHQTRLGRASELVPAWVEEVLG